MIQKNINSSTQKSNVFVLSLLNKSEDWYRKVVQPSQDTLSDQHTKEPHSKYQIYACIDHQLNPGHEVMCANKEGWDVEGGMGTTKVAPA